MGKNKVPAPTCPSEGCGKKLTRLKVLQPRDPNYGRTYDICSRCYLRFWLDEEAFNVLRDVNDPCPAPSSLPIPRGTLDRRGSMSRAQSVPPAQQARPAYAPQPRQPTVPLGRYHTATSLGHPTGAAPSFRSRHSSAGAPDGAFPSRNPTRPPGSTPYQAGRSPPPSARGGGFSSFSPTASVHGGTRPPTPLGSEFGGGGPVFYGARPATPSSSHPSVMSRPGTPSGRSTPVTSSRASSMDRSAIYDEGGQQADIYREDDFGPDGTVDGGPALVEGDVAPFPEPELGADFDAEAGYTLGPNGNTPSPRTVDSPPMPPPIRQPPRRSATLPVPAPHYPRPAPIHPGPRPGSTRQAVPLQPQQSTFRPPAPAQRRSSISTIVAPRVSSAPTWHPNRSRSLSTSSQHFQPREPSDPAPGAQAQPYNPHPHVPLSDHPAKPAPSRASSGGWFGAIRNLGGGVQVQAKSFSASSREPPKRKAKVWTATGGFSLDGPPAPHTAGSNQTRLGETTRGQLERGGQEPISARGGRFRKLSVGAKTYRWGNDGQGSWQDAARDDDQLPPHHHHQLHQSRPATYQAHDAQYPDEGEAVYPDEGPGYDQPPYEDGNGLDGMAGYEQDDHTAPVDPVDGHGGQDGYGGGDDDGWGEAPGDGGEGGGRAVPTGA